MVKLKRGKVIVTGGAGFIGSSLVTRLVAEGASVRVIDNLWRGKLENLKDACELGFDLEHDFHLADLMDYGRCLELIRDANIVYHLADVVAGVDYVFSHESFVFRQNIVINSNVLWACLTNNIRNYVYVGTACSFPKKLQNMDGVAALREDQTYPAEPESSYGWGKLMGEYEAELAQATYPINVGLLRLHNVYGPKASFELGRSQALPALVRKAVLFPEEDFIIWGSGSQYRDFVYIDDVVDALCQVADRGMNRGLIQIGTGRAVNLTEAAENIIRISGKRIDLKYDPSKPEGDRGRIGICDRAKEILGWYPKFDFEDGIEKTYRWIESEISDARTKALPAAAVGGF